MKEVTVRTGDVEAPRESRALPVVLILDRLRSAYNVGNIFRIAEAARVEEIAACGYTACPPHEKLEKTARGCDKLVPCRHFETAAEAVGEYRGRGYAIYGVETVEGAQWYWNAEIRFPCALILGNEALGVSEEALSLCDGFISLPSFGCKNSINVGNCAAVVVFECLKRTLVEPS